MRKAALQKPSCSASVTVCLSCLGTGTGFRAAPDGLFFSRLPAPQYYGVDTGFQKLLFVCLSAIGGGGGDKMIEGKINYYFSSLTK